MITNKPTDVLNMPPTHASLQRWQHRTICTSKRLLSN